MEGIRANEDYTPELQKKIAADTKAKDQLYQYQFQKALRARGSPTSIP
jgi:hypothetical protein